MSLPTRQILKRRSFEGIELSRSLYLPEARLPLHSHQNPRMVLVLQGAFAETVENHTRQCNAPALIVRPAGEEHADHFQREGALCINVDIEPVWAERLKQNSCLFQRSAEFHSDAMARLSFRLQQEIDQEDDAARLAVESLLLEMAVEISNEPDRMNRGPAWVREAKGMLDDLCLEKFTVSEVALRVGTHPVTLVRVFRKTYGCTIGEYVRRLRIRHACRQLILSTDSLTDIASASGFSDQSHFSRLFKIHTGMTPARFRAAHHSEKS